MKKSKFIEKVLKDTNNTVFVSKEQVANAIECFQRAGMLPPKSLDSVSIKKKIVAGYTMMFEWDDE